MRHESKKTKFWRFMSNHVWQLYFPINLFEMICASVGSATIIFGTIGSKGRLGNVLAWILQMCVCTLSLWKFTTSAGKLEDIAEDMEELNSKRDEKTIHVVTNEN